MICGISGKARSGKNVFAEMLAEELQRRTGKAFVMMAYADDLKNMAQKELDLSWEQLWGDEKEIEDRRYKKIPRYSHGGFHETGDLKEPYWTGREIMQSLGEFFRGFDRDFWVKKLFRTIEEKEYENVIITDVRYPNEVDPIVDREGYHIRVNRPDASAVHGQLHTSETSLDAPYKVDFTVLNVGTLDDLRKLAGDIANGITQLESLKKGGLNHG